MSYSSDSSSSDDEELDRLQAARKFELAELVNSRFKDTSSTAFDHWSFYLHDGVFERQANFCTSHDLWRHLERIDSSLTSIRRRGKKGTCRLFRNKNAALFMDKVTHKDVWDSDESRAGGKWVIRFSRKFSQDLSDMWAKLVLGSVAEEMPRSDLVAGCTFTTKKGKCEIEILMLDDPTSEPLQGVKSAPLSSEEQQLAIRDLLGVTTANHKAIQVQYKSHQGEWQKKQDYERVMEVQSRLTKKRGANTWPYVNRSEEPNESTEEQLAKYRAQVHANPYEEYVEPTSSQQYHYDYPEDEPAATQSYQYDYPDEEAQTPRIPLSALRTASLKTATQPHLPPLSLEQLQQLHLSSLTLSRCEINGESDHEGTIEGETSTLDLASLRTRLDSLDVSDLSSFESNLACLRSRSDSVDIVKVPRHAEASLPKEELSTPSCTKTIAPFECWVRPRPLITDTVPSPPLGRRTKSLCDFVEAEDGEASDFDVFDQSSPKMGVKISLSEFDSPKMKFGVLGTNPPDFSSPIMKTCVEPARRLVSFV